MREIVNIARADASLTGIEILSPQPKNSNRLSASDRDGSSVGQGQEKNNQGNNNNSSSVNVLDIDHSGSFSQLSSPLHLTALSDFMDSLGVTELSTSLAALKEVIVWLRSVPTQRSKQVRQGNR